MILMDVNILVYAYREETTDHPASRDWVEDTINSGGAPDAYHAALAIESGCDWITTDKGFLRFAGLRARHPLRKAL